MTQLLDAYADNEVDIATAALMNHHLAACPACAAALERIRSVRALDFSALAWKTPTDTAARIRAAIAAESSQPAITPEPSIGTTPATAARRNFWFSIAVAAVILLAVSLFSTMLIHNRSANQLLATDILAAHLRSMQANHLLDVVSTDQHTVKPWFDGKLDFAPPVKDFATEGFPLAGGRLDYFDNHPAAALIYRRGKHIINVFIWPTNTASPSIAPTTTSLQGYSVLTWTHANMHFSAASDLNPTELAQLAALLQN